MRRARGFTLIELALVLIIVGVLCTFAIAQMHRIEEARISFMTECLKTSTHALCTAKWRNSR